ncbi:MAG: hypothetical protein HC781_07955 [Leptolyngbyaceae cyanobacterium CSU_1_4]|nr:hypothetical protein [Leptolyngbyaceae cyanobacterium CSU_1_4]
MAFTALRLIKNVTQFVAMSLLIFFAILLANRSLNPRFDDLAIFLPSRQPNVQADRPSPSSPNLEDYRRSGQDLVAGFSKNVENFSDSLDAFVYGPQAKVGWQTLPEKLPATELRRIPAQASQRSVRAPGSRQTPAPRPASMIPRPTPTQRPISAWW